GRMALSSKEHGTGYDVFHQNVYIWDPDTNEVIQSYNLAPLQVDDNAGFTLIDDE
ncbi:MAG: hypothetical protein GY711_00040, partial [bacterium]|nr:hypothetical protein [bacterium]